MECLIDRCLTNQYVLNSSMLLKLMGYFCFVLIKVSKMKVYLLTSFSILSIIRNFKLFVFHLGRDSKIHVFRLSDFDGEVVVNESTVKGRADLKEHRLERTRSCSMYAISRPGGSHLRMVSI